jgi:hypothetical protein
MRIPAAPPLIARASDVTIDARAFNGVIEAGDVVKRPGVETTSYNYANAQGALGMQGFLITVYDDTLDVFDYVPMPPPVYIGDLVGGYYAMVDNPSTSPGGGDAYWSATPPGADRFRCVWNTSGTGGGGGNVIALSPTTPNYMIGNIAASSAAAAKVWVEGVIGANLAGVAALDDTSGYSPDVVASSYLFNTPTAYTIVSTAYVQMSVAGKNAFLAPAYPGGWPSGVDWTSPTTFNANVGLLRKRRTTTSFTLTSSGTTATLASGALLGPYQWIEISGCNEPEYNGTFYAVRQLDSTYPWLSANEWKFTLPGVPSASPATGTKSMQYYGAL